MRLFILVCTVTVILVCAIVAAVWIGLSKVQDEILPEVKRCGKDWCVLDSVSGKTSWDEIKKLCKKYTCLSNRIGTLHIDDIQPGFRLYFQQDQSGIAINITLSDVRQPSLASWLAYYGEPCGISIDPFGHASLLYPSMELGLGEFNSFQKPDFALNAPVYGIWIYAHERNLCTETLSGWHTIPWQGFKSPYNYWQLAGW